MLLAGGVLAPDVYLALTTPAVTAILEKTIRRSGVSICSVRYIHFGRRQPGEPHFSGVRPMVCIDARDETTGESYVIKGPDEYECLVELAVQVGFDLEDG